jgi:4-amino-4-deoxy-L-arabinose transferase-like glycosyltransferase
MDQDRPGTGLILVGRHIALVLAVAVLSLFLGLGRAPVHRTQEVRVLETAREMGERRDLIHPRFCGEPRYQKPPLAYWLAFAGFELTGGPGEWGGRLYSALSGAAVALILYAFGRSLGRPRLGVLAAVIFLTSILPHTSGRSAETDMLLAATTSGALYAFWRSWEFRGQTPRSADFPAAGRHARLGWTVLAWALMGLGVLAKGQAGIAYPLVPAVLYLLVSRRRRDLARAFHPLGIAVFSVIAAPWFIAVWEPALETFRKEIRDVTEGTDHGKVWIYAVFFYALRVWPDFLPWSPLLIPAGVALCGRRLRGPGDLFFLSWAGGIFLLLEFMGNKQRHYFLSALPALALLIADWLDGGWPWEARFPPRRRIQAAAAVAALTLAGFTAWTFAFQERESRGERSREFALAVRATVDGEGGKAPLFFLGDLVPAVDFYLDRVVPLVPAKPADLDALLGREGRFFLIVREPKGGKAAPVTAGKPAPTLWAADLAADPRFRLVLQAEPGEMPLRLFAR